MIPNSHLSVALIMSTRHQKDIKKGKEQLNMVSLQLYAITPENTQRKASRNSRKGPFAKIFSTKFAKNGHSRIFCPAKIFRFMVCMYILLVHPLSNMYVWLPVVCMEGFFCKVRMSMYLLKDCLIITS